MNWDMVAAVGEIVGAVAVVASLIFLTRQVALSNRLAKAEAWRSRITELTNLNSSFGSDPRFHRAMVRVFQGAKEHDLDEGILDQRALDEYPGRIGLPFFRETWPLIKSTLGGPFVQFAEREHGLRSAPENREDARAGAV